MEAVQQWKYKPYLLNGQPTEVETTINVNYTLAASDSPGQSGGTGGKASTPQAEQQDKGAMPTLSVAKKTGDGVTAPELIYVVEPELTDEAKKAKFMGFVFVNLIVDARGMPQNVHVVRGVGMGLDEKAVETAKQYRFRPAMEDGKPVPVELNVEVNFKVMDSPGNDAASNPNGPSASESSPPMQSAPQEYGGVPVRKIGGGVTTPELIYKVDPEFSAEARKAKFEGIVLVNFIVDAKGKPQDVRVLRGVGLGLDEKALKAVRAYRFRPATEYGKPVPVGLNVEVNFKIF
jgi:TonB family protein